MPLTKDLLTEERIKGETSICPNCGKEFWVKYLTGVKFTKYCGPCYFKRHK